jgi:FdhE protein
VPATTLHRFFRRQAPLPEDVQAALRKLEQLAETQPDLQELAATNAALLQAMYAHALPRPHVVLDAEHAMAKREAGLPLLRGEPVVWEAKPLVEQFVRLCGVMQAQGNQFAAGLAQATKAGRFAVDELAAEVVAGDPNAVAARAVELDLDAGLAATLLRLALFPTMARLARELDPLLAPEDWRRGYCPCCGAWPLLGEYRGLELTRLLRCGLCATEWEIDRLVCPFCDNRVHQDLINLQVAGEEQKQRAAACERCHCYVKQISTLVPIPAPELLVADLATLHLDLVALQRNYMPAQ